MTSNRSRIHNSSDSNENVNVASTIGKLPKESRKQLNNFTFDCERKSKFPLKSLENQNTKSVISPLNWEDYEDYTEQKISKPRETTLLIPKMFSTQDTKGKKKTNTNMYQNKENSVDLDSPKKILKIKDSTEEIEVEHTNFIRSDINYVRGKNGKGNTLKRKDHFNSSNAEYISPIDEDVDQQVGNMKNAEPPELHPRKLIRKSKQLKALTNNTKNGKKRVQRHIFDNDECVNNKIGTIEEILESSDSTFVNTSYENTKNLSTFDENNEVCSISFSDISEPWKLVTQSTVLSKLATTSNLKDENEKTSISQVTRKIKKVKSKKTKIAKAVRGVWKRSFDFLVNVENDPESDSFSSKEDVYENYDSINGGLKIRSQIWDGRRVKRMKT